MIFFLIGFMGCGKSTLGRKAAARTGCLFADTDRIAEAWAGKTICNIFAEEGEEAFRQIESKVLHTICREYDANETNLIVATGGGLPCRDENIDLMKRHGTVIFLDTAPENLFRRLSEGRQKRPKTASLNDIELMEFIRKSLTQRERYYSQATVRICCNGISDKEIISNIIRCVQNSCPGTPGTKP